MAGNLSLSDKKVLERFIQAGPKDFELLYSFTKHGADPAIFHKRCDKSGPTVTVIYNTLDSVYGGFTEVSWTQDKATSRDEHAFLFRLQLSGKSAPKKFPITKPDSATYCCSTYGPTFGSGYDLFTFSGKIESTDAYYTTNATYSFGNTYDMAGVSGNQITNDIKTVKDLEVYRVTDSLLIPEWRDSDGWEQMDLEELKNEIDSYSPPPRLGLKHSNILLLGPIGAGKSSFFNTISSVFRGHVTAQAVCGSALQSVTSKYQIYRVRGSALSKPMKFRLCDTRGLEENQGIDATELGYILDGIIPNEYQFNPSVPISSDIPGIITKPTINEKIHCVCFVMDGSTASVMSEKMLEKVKALQTRVRQRGIPQVVLVTKIDKVCAHVEEDVSTTFQSAAIKELVNTVSSLLGVPRGHVLPVKNYEKEIKVRIDVSILALFTIRQILRATDDYMFNFLDSVDDSDVVKSPVVDAKPALRPSVKKEFIFT